MSGEKAPSIWFRDRHPEDLNQQAMGNMVGHLGIVFTEVGPDFLVATMPVDGRTRQPAGLLHGGASVTLAETLGSFGGYLTVDASRFACVGQEINASHLRAVTAGIVTGIARAIRIGRRSQVWGINITDDRDRLVCVSRLTLAVVDKSEAGANG